MPAPEINLLAEAPPGHTWLEVILDLEPSDFQVGHVRGLCRSLARSEGLENNEVSVVSIVRWQPIVTLELPKPSAEGILTSFESSSTDLLRALGELPVRSMRLDREGVRTLSVSPPASSATIDALVRFVAREGAGLLDRSSEPLFEDANDVLFIKVMLLTIAVTVLIFWIGN